MSQEPTSARKASKLLHDFDRVVLACGASNPRDINAPGRDAEGIYFAVDFLKANTRSLLDSNFEDKKYVERRPRGKMWLSSAAVIPVMTALEPPSVTEQNL